MAACAAYALWSLAARSSRRPSGRVALFAISTSHASFPSPAMFPAQGWDACCSPERQSQCPVQRATVEVLTPKHAVALLGYIGTHRRHSSPKQCLGISTHTQRPSFRQDSHTRGQRAGSQVHPRGISPQSHNGLCCVTRLGFPLLCQLFMCEEDLEAGGSPRAQAHCSATSYPCAQSRWRMSIGAAARTAAAGSEPAHARFVQIQAASSTASLARRIWGLCMSHTSVHVLRELAIPGDAYWQQGSIYGWPTLGAQRIRGGT